MPSFEALAKHKKLMQTCPTTMIKKTNKKTKTNLKCKTTKLAPVALNVLWYNSS